MKEITSFSIEAPLEISHRAPDTPLSTWVLAVVYPISGPCNTVIKVKTSKTTKNVLQFIQHYKHLILFGAMFMYIIANLKYFCII